MFAFQSVAPVCSSLQEAVESVCSQTHQITNCTEGVNLQELSLVPLSPACSAEGSFQLFCVETGASLNTSFFHLLLKGLTSFCLTFEGLFW